MYCIITQEGMPLVTFKLKHVSPRGEGKGKVLSVSVLSC